MHGMSTESVTGAVQVYEAVPHPRGASTVAPGAQAGVGHPSQPSGGHGQGAVCGVGRGSQKSDPLHPAG